MSIDIRSALQRRNVRQSKLADDLGISRGYVSEMVAGKKEPSTELLQRIATYLSISPAELFIEHATNAKQDRSHGFSEPGEAFFVTNTEKVSLTDMDLVTSGTRNSAILRVAATNPFLGLRVGDLAVIDMNVKTAYGKLSAVTRADLKTGSAVTLLRRIERGYIASSDPMESGERWESTAYNYAVLGRVIRIVRDL